MESPQSPSGSVRRHGRNVSHLMLKRTMKDPLDAGDDPLAEPAQRPSVASPSDIGSSMHSAEPQPSPNPEPALAVPSKPSVDLKFLQAPSIYHQLSTEEIASTFIQSKNQPPQASPLSQLIQQGHFRRAAEASLETLLQCPSNEANIIFQLLYTRLACLVLISRPDLASREATPLIELFARNPPSAKEIVPLIPWELRLLLVRLQSMGAVDGGRRGIMALYALASEVRANIQMASTDSDHDEASVWSSRLRDLGLRVADALVEMGELETATRHLDTLVDVDQDQVASRKALLRIRVGDVDSARQCLNVVKDQDTRSALEALSMAADGDFSASADAWQRLVEQQSGQALFSENLAVSMLYTGHITRAREILERSVEQFPAYPGLLFNLSTIYELCTEHAVDRKAKFAQRLADKQPEPDSGGWERAKFELKL